MLYFLIGLCLVPFITVICLRNRWNKSDTEETQNQVDANHTANQGSMNHVKTNHLKGLPIAEGAACNIRTYQNHIVFVSGMTHIRLERKKITDMRVKTETELQKQYVSSAGGALGGALLFGALGAMVGGRTKQKTISETTYYMIISYNNSDGEPAFLYFQITDTLSAANKVVDEFYELNKNSVTHIDL